MFVKKRKLFATSVIAALACGSIFGVQTAAHANPHYHYIKDKRVVSSSYTNYSNELASCRALSNNVTCTAAVSRGATRTIGVDLGMSRSLVAAGLNISAGHSVSFNTSCTSPPLRAGQTFRAYPRGVRYSYKVVRVVITQVTTSGTLYAFNPSANQISCGVR